MTEKEIIEKILFLNKSIENLTSKSSFSEQYPGAIKKSEKKETVNQPEFPSEDLKKFFNIKKNYGLF